MLVDETLLSQVADIVTAHVSNNAVAPNDLAGLIQSVHGALAGLGAPVEPVEEKRTPAVSVRASVKSDAITCLDCGTKIKVLKRHLSSEHGLTPDDYRARWNLPRDYPMVAPEYTARRKELALSLGLGRKPKAVDAVPAPKVAAPAKPAAKRKAAPVKAMAVLTGDQAAATRPKARPRKKLKVALGDSAPATAATDVPAKG
ncbi:MucR family transcriptional regulator [Novosphingobium sp. ES2-1]|uniref:MucR family transcriptional regulator n=2 Tax=unclassified Novosphingobium TaxID=2644732 RepID=UPI000A8276DB|nr:MucR family transcriptional regulator [Novosphingobium sp. ES2-1]